ncbi:MAG: serine hydroxymethyltransferase [Acholeplasmatales bacterium]|nr:serine hydroxymethyltransferase [Acholeplasmatales bacterium]
MKDNEILGIIKEETQRQNQTIELIASENFVSRNILKINGSILTNKYAEGYPGKRYYGGCEVIDKIEILAKKYGSELFNAEHINVQPYSGSGANAAVYLAVLKPGDKVLALSLNSGGHLTHGHPLSSSGILYDFHHYEVDPLTNLIDYDELEKQALILQPKLIVGGASNYSRIIDFARLQDIAVKCGALLMIDMAHIAGLVATGLHPSPVPYADFVTSTTHKTLRGPRSGFIICRKKWASIIDRSVFPGLQGGPHLQTIAAKAQCFYDALQPEFKVYQNQILKNIKALESEFKALGVEIIAGGSDNHLLSINVAKTFGINGSEAEKLLDNYHITVNKNTIPYDPNPPLKPSGIRLGTAAMTTRGLKEDDFKLIAKTIFLILSGHVEETIKNNIETVLKNCQGVEKL